MLESVGSSQADVVSDRMRITLLHLSEMEARDGANMELELPERIGGNEYSVLTYNDSVTVGSTDLEEEKTFNLVRQDLSLRGSSSGGQTAVYKNGNELVVTKR